MGVKSHQPIQSFTSRTTLAHGAVLVLTSFFIKQLPSTAGESQEVWRHRQQLLPNDHTLGRGRVELHGIIGDHSMLWLTWLVAG